MHTTTNPDTEFYGVRLACVNSQGGGIVKGLEAAIVNGVLESGSKEKFEGVQIGMGNGDANVNGIQIGLMNVYNAPGSETNGVQIGILNGAPYGPRITGLQLGVSNFAETGRAVGQIGVYNQTNQGERKRRSCLLNYDARSKP